jgi:hypothetical protein
MHFARDAVFETLNGSPAWNDRLRLCSIHDTEQENFDQHADNKALAAQFVGVKHSSSSQRNQASMRPHTGAFNSRGSSYFNTLRLTRGNVRYDRIFTFADLNTPGKCFAIITETVAESDHLLRHLREESAVGDVVMIVEPEAPTRALNDMPVISTIEPLIPVAMPDNMPAVPLKTPDPGQQRYFILRNVPITISRVSIVPASCKGVLCDRQQPPNRFAQCGCLFTSRATAIVLQGHVTYTYVNENQHATMYTVKNFRSHRVTKLFIAPVTATTDSTPYFEAREEIRSIVRESIELVNEEGGWMMMGWYRRGEVQDASATQEAGSEIASSNQPIHISYLYPENHEAIAHLEERRFVPHNQQH